MRRFRGTLLCLVGVLGLVAAACDPQPPGPTNAAPTAVVTATPTSGDAPLEVTFSPDGSTDSDGTISQWRWDFGDGSAVETLTTGDEIAHTYTSEGLYTATLTVVDDKGATKSATAQINVGAVNAPPVADAVASATSGKAPLAVDFTGSGSTDSDGTIAAYEWDFGDGSALSTEADPSHTYTDAGLYTAQLTVTDDDGATGTATVTISVDANQPPTAIASGTPLVGKFPLPVQFTGSDSTDADGTIASYSWNFGDGSAVSTAADPSHTYTAAGEYTATLTVTDDSGDTSSATVTVTVNANQAPTAVANASPTSGQAPLTVNFSSASSTDSDGTIVSRSWDFGDGNGSTQANPTYTYAAAGTYTATLTVTDDNGATDSDQVVVDVSPIPNVPPVAQASGTPTSGKEPLTVSFSSAGSNDPDGTTLTYAWDFGDGGSSTQANPSHTYTAAGIYTATLTVKDSANATNSATVQITVIANQAPVAVASGSPLTGKEDLTVAFSSAGSNDPDGTTLTYAWDFGDGGSSTQANPSHTYTTPGGYTATLTVTDSNGATASAQVNVTVIANQAPVAAANADVQSGPRPLVVAFDSDESDDPDGTIVSYSWNFGDGSPASSSPNPSHTYTSAGTFTAVLTVTDDNGVTDTDQVVITVVIDDDGDGVSPPADCDDNAAGTYPGAPDPLGDNTDTNCDGGDGVVAQQTYVSSGGGSDTSACGTKAEPCATIGFALGRAQSTGRDVLLVAGGTYPRFSVVNGYDVRGGFGQNFLRGGAATGATLASVNGSFDASFGASAGIIANGINATTLVSDLRVVGANESGNGRASYGVIVRNSTSALTMDTITVIGGVGGNGASGGSGANATQSPAQGGGNGQDGDDPFSACSTTRKSGGGGAGGGGNGGQGGAQDTNCGVFSLNLNATSGNGGGSASVTGPGCGGGGGGGAANTTSSARDGGNGQPGCESHGAGGGSGIASNGAISGGLWAPSGGVGGNGTLGGNGGPGGGGGGGGANDDGANNDDRGGGGGGGGAGGTRAPAAGSGGQAGHASIAVLVTGSQANLVNFDVTLGTGGQGGQGGSGGLGQPGGSGGSGGARIDVGGRGGNGGNGGRGGHSGAGGGGAGGPSFGIVTSGSSANLSGASFSGGSGGAGGAGGTNGIGGAAGQTGPKANTVNL